jgi:sugar phosphate isomerase/epimerase
MTKRIALQLYTVRELANQDYEGVVRKVAEMGYDGVETAGFPGTTAEAAAKLFEALGLTVTSAHVPLPLGANQQMVLETMDALGKPPLVCTEIRPDDVKTVDTIRNLCDRLNQGYEVAQQHELSFGIHNHWWEFGDVDGRMAHHIMLEMLDPGVFFELDTYWIKVAGRDPAAIVESLGARVPLLHIKDGPGTHQEPMTAVGDGVMNIPAILRAAGPDVWQIVEMDHCATDILEATRKSYDYLANLQV